MTTGMSVTELVNLDKYPLIGAEPAALEAIIEPARAMLAHDGACVLPGFLSDEGLALMVADAAGVTETAWPSPDRVTPYYGKLAHNFLPGHPRRTRQRADMALVADFNIPARSHIKRLYEWPPLRGFLACVLGVERLYAFADPCQTVNISVMRDGGEQPWHFDSGRCTVTLLLQQACSGGEFEYVPGLRSSDNENYPGVAGVLAGEHESVRRAKLTPGTLFVFLGEHALPRVVSVAGPTPRLIVIYLYDPSPERWSVRSSNVSLYGPEAEAAMDAVGMHEGSAR